MRAARVFYLLISLLQFIFFLKLVEYVRGEQVRNTPNFKELLRTANERKPFEVSGNGEEEAARGLFLAPKMRRKRIQKMKNQTTVSPEITGAKRPPELEVEPLSLATSQQHLDRNDAASIPQPRLCPGCENNECQSVNPISAGFPIVPVVISIAVGVAWFILFLIFWLFFVRPNHKDQGGGYGGGYDAGGYGSPEPQYGPGGDEHESDDGQGSIFDHFLKPHERSLQSYTRFVSYVLDSIGKVADLYNDA